MLVTRITDTFCGHFFALILWLALTLFGSIAAIEMPADFMRESANLMKSTEFARHAQFPSTADMNAEMRPNLEQDVDNENDETDFEEHEDNFRKQHSGNGNGNGAGNSNNVAFGKLVHRHKHPHRHPHRLNHHKLRPCFIEVTKQIPGVCQPMPPIGSGCVSDDYVDAFNENCM